jgi:hypothetical protein
MLHGKLLLVTSVKNQRWRAQFSQMLRNPVTSKQLPHLAMHQLHKSTSELAVVGNHPRNRIQNALQFVSQDCDCFPVKPPNLYNSRQRDKMRISLEELLNLTAVLHLCINLPTRGYSCNQTAMVSWQRSEALTH